jgi:hypothetical protein
MIIWGASIYKQFFQQPDRNPFNVIIIYIEELQPSVDTIFNTIKQTKFI